MICDQVRETNVQGASWDTGHKASVPSMTESLTENFVIEAMTDVMAQMELDGDFAGRMKYQQPMEQHFARLTAETMVRSHASDILQLPDGKKMLAFASRIISKERQTLPGGNDEKQFSACLVASLMRTMLLELRTVMRSGQLRLCDLPELAQAIKTESMEQESQQ